MSDTRPITRVGHIRYDGARFCGRGVFDEIMREVPSADALLALSLGLRLDEAGVEVLRLCGVALLSPDARVWPLKTVRVLASYGDPITAFLGGQLVAASPYMGPGAARGAAEMLAAIAAQVDDPDDHAAVEAASLAYLADHPRLFGFGVPFRDEDERLLGLRDAIATRTAARGRHYRLHLHVGRAIAAHREVQPNLVLGLAALLLDLGLPPRRASFAVAMLLRPAFAAHALEAADRDGPLLRELPPESLAYVGVAPRSLP